MEQTAHKTVQTVWKIKKLDVVDSTVDFGSDLMDCIAFRGQVMLCLEGL